MYRTLVGFIGAVRAADPPYSEQALKTINLSWAVYLGAQEAKLNLLVLGRWVRESIGNELGVDESVEDNFRNMNGTTVGGSLVKVPDADWSVLVNDAWVLGGIHSLSTFCLSTPRKPGNVYNMRHGHDFYHHLTVLGRELVGLMAFGYAIRRDHPALGEVAVCVDAGLAKAATFAAYSRHIAAYTASQQLRTRLFAPEYGGPAVGNITQAMSHRYSVRPR